jgi:hypothetical protein
MKEIRPLDYLLAVLATAAGVYAMYENVTGAWSGGLPHPQTTTTVAMLPLFLAVTVPILWRRRNILAAVQVTAVATALHVFLFGYETRCAVLVPLSLALAYAVGRFAHGRSEHLTCLGSILLLQVVFLQRDASIDTLLSALPLTVALGGLFYGIGYAVQVKITKKQDHEQAAALVAA